MKRFNFGFLLLVVLLIQSWAITTATGETSMENQDSCDKSYADVTITEANYGDVDGDGDADDVYATVRVDLFCNNRYMFDYYILLTQPSGLEVDDALSVNTAYSTLTFYTVFYNYAIESGDYRIDVDVTLMNHGPTTTSESVIFDPPGGVSGTGSVQTTVL